MTINKLFVKYKISKPNVYHGYT